MSSVVSESATSQANDILFDLYEVNLETERAIKLADGKELWQLCTEIEDFSNEEADFFERNALLLVRTQSANHRD